MALLVLIFLGSTIGWLGSILARTEAPGAILRQIVVGIIAALTGGLLANSGGPLGGLSLLSLGIATIATVAVLVVYHAVFSRSEDAEA